MKIAIITLYDYYNCGSFLQAYAMQKYLKAMGHEVYFVRTQSVKRRIRRAYTTHKTAADIIYHTKKILTYQKAFSKLKQIKASQINRMDAVVIGSDELWNTDNGSFNQFPFYYGVGYESVPTIVYAMSLGNGDAETFRKHDYIIPAIQSLKYIYARDKNTADSISKITGRIPELVCDPTLLLSRNSYIENHKRIVKVPYILVYSYGMPEYLNSHIQKFAKKNKLLIVTASLKSPIADVELNCSPLDFPSVINDASYIVTTTFHGSIFSVLNQKNFVVLPYAKKTSDFLKMVGLETRILQEDCDYEKFNSIITCIPDYSTVNPILLELREKSMEVLRDFLNKAQNSKDRDGPQFG